MRRLADQAMRAIAEEDGDRSPEQPALIDAVARAFEDLYPILRRINTKRARLDTRKLGRMLSGLEEELLRRLHAALGSSAPLAAIRSVADRMLKQAQVDRLVEDRDRAQRAWARAEDGLRQVGAADAGGPSAPGTGTQAVPRSPESGTSADHPADPPAPLLERIKYIAALTDLLRQLERWPSTPASARPPLRSILTGINRHLETAAAQGERKVAELEGALRRTPLPAPAEVPSAQRDLEATRMTLLASLAEIGQEILQPLTVLQTSLTILLDGRFGDMDPGQRELVDLCAGAAQRMQRLTNRIVALVGEPSSRQPDGNLLGRLYAPAD